MTTLTTKLLSGYDLSFRISADLTNGQYIDAIANVSIVEDYPTSFVRVINESGSLYIGLWWNTTIVEKFYCSTVMPHVVQIVYYHEYISVSFDGVGVHNFYPESVTYYTDDTEVSIRCSYAVTLANVRLKELYDWREAIYADIESTSQAAISTVIQQRPVEIFGSSNGSLRYQYFPLTRPQKTLGSFVQSHSVTRNPNNQICSEGIVYFTNTGIKLDQPAFDNFGFITRTFRMPDLDSGAMKATFVMQLRARQAVESHDIVCRFDPTLEVGDQLTHNIVLPGTGTNVTLVTIIEAISISMSSGRFAMKIKGRGNGQT
jgi:hypothetical protein